MIGLVFSMLNARRAQAVTLFLLAAIAVAAAVAGPVAARAVDAAVVRLEVENATGLERTISLVMLADPTSADGDRQVSTVMGYVELPGFEIIRGGELGVAGPVADPAELSLRSDSRLVYRDGVCAHLIIREGRCLAGGLEILIGSDTAQRTRLAPGAAARMQAIRYEGDAPVPDGDPVAVTVVGVYDPVDDDEPYWGGQVYFPVNADGARQEAVFIGESGMALVGHTTGVSYVDALAPLEELTAQRLVGLPAEVGGAVEQIEEIGGISIVTHIPRLGERVATSRALASQIGPVAFVPLAGVSLFVIYLAVAYGVFGRRTELALVALRGVSLRRRWVLATGETVVAILLGAPVGYVLGHLGVRLVAQARLGSSEGSGLSLESLPYAAAAVAVALVVALLGQRRSLREPVVELLRGVPRGRGVRSAIAFDVLLGALAVLAALQLRTAGAGLSGLGLLAPGLVIVAVALIAARLNVAVTGRMAGFALRRGLVGTGLGGVQLARRPGSRRLFVLLAVGTAMLAYVAAGLDVASRAREDRASVQTGAARVLHLVGADPARMLAATAALDPAGVWAMAAVVLDQSAVGPERLPLLAVDTSRLGTVPVWQAEYGADPESVAAALAPPEPRPVQVHGTSIEVDIGVVRYQLGADSPDEPVTLNLEFVTSDGRRVSTPLSNLETGSYTVTASTPSCAEGCRLVGFSAPDLPPFTTELQLRGLRQLDPPADVLPSALLADRLRWHASPEVRVVATQRGLLITLSPDQFGEYQARVAVVDAPVPVPVAAAGEREAPVITSLDDNDMPSQVALKLSMLPRLGSEGVLADLRSLERTMIGPAILGEGEIWLGPAAPADAIDQLRDFGLQIPAESTAAERRAMLDRQGPALALHFHLAAATFGVLLALGGLGLAAAVDRRQRAADLYALRVQGLPRRMVRRAALWGYLSTVVLAALTGLGGAAVAWATAGDRVPIFTDTAPGLDPPRWPVWLAVVRPWAVATLAMMAAAVLAAWALRRAVVRGNGGAR